MALACLLLPWRLLLLVGRWCGGCPVVANRRFHLSFAQVRMLCC